MKTVKATLKRPYSRGILQYRLIARVHDGRKCFDLEISLDRPQSSDSVLLEDITESAESALKLAALFFNECVEPCHARDILEDMLPLEDAFTTASRTDL